jgi:hypothetical protein
MFWVRPRISQGFKGAAVVGEMQADGMQILYRACQGQAAAKGTGPVAGPNETVSKIYIIGKTRFSLDKSRQSASHCGKWSSAGRLSGR